MENKFKKYSANEDNPKWKNIIKREKEIYKRKDDIRSEFERDYTRLLHCNAYRRLKHKTQVFFSPENDHICTRIEHVMHVESVSYTIAKYLGLNTELTKAIATGHDIGHSPFGHEGERILSEISKRDLGESFWHERNGLEYVDKIELLEDINKNMQNLNLTYAVRDGIISHCGEVDENGLKPREEYIDLDEYKLPNQYAPYTWEGCVVKIADKISYLGRDIEDAITLGILDKKLEEFNYKHIYFIDKIKQSSRYFRILINEIYFTLKNIYDGENTLNNMESMKKFYPEVVSNFQNWLKSYWNFKRNSFNKNDVIFDISNERDFYKAIIYYISGMTDNFAIDTYNKIIGF